MIDWGRVIELRDEVGPDEFEPVLDLFIDEVEDIVMRLCRDDPARLERDLHFLKGSAWNLGFADFGRLCQQGEAAAALRRMDEIGLEELAACYASSKQVFMRDLAYVTGARDAGMA